MNAAIAALQAEGVSLDGINLDDISADAYSPIQGLSSKEATARKLAANNGGADDMIHLDDLDLDGILANLHLRYHRDVIYTYIGSILVSVNSFKPIAGLYDDPRAFRGRNVTEMPPHLYALAEKARAALVGAARNQSFIISGESGAGKTEAMKIVCRYLTTVAGGNQQVSKFIGHANDVIEAFGNAKTIHNANSSRFGKWTELQMDRDGQLLGASIHKYLLEKGRVVSQALDERNFHCFYYLLAGASDADKAKLHLTGYRPDNLNYLRHSGCYTIRGVNDAAQYRLLLTNMTMFSEDDKVDMQRLLAGILLIGQIDFVFDPETKNVRDVVDRKALHAAADVLGVDHEAFHVALTTHERIIAGEASSSPVTFEQAIEHRNALAKFAYDRLFTWLVETMSAAMACESTGHFIGILDIFGFENFAINSFEQFCINFANEHLQQFFTQFIFAAEQAEYEADGVPVDRIAFTDNKPCLDMIAAKNTGLQAILDEQSYFPQATDATLLDKFVAALGSHANFGKPSAKEHDAFRIVHYAGTVQYDIEGFLDKNRDLLPPQIALLCMDSKFARLCMLFENAAAAERYNDIKRAGARSPSTLRRRVPTASSQFKESLEKLLQTLEPTTPHFVRCIKPNSRQVADDFQREYVVQQLIYAGVLETVRIRRQGFAVRYTFADFVTRFVLLLPVKARVAITEQKDAQAGAGMLMRALNAPTEEYCFGRTKLFLKDRVAGLLETRLGLVQAERMRLLKEQVERLKAEAEEKKRREEERKRREEEERRRAEEERKRLEEEERLRVEEEHRVARLAIEEEERQRLAERKRREEERRRREEERVRAEEERQRIEDEERRAREAERRRRLEEEERRWADIQDSAMADVLAMRTLKNKRSTIHLEMFDDIQRENTLRRKDRDKMRQSARELRETLRKNEREEGLKQLADLESSEAESRRLMREASTEFLALLPPQAKLR